MQEWGDEMGEGMLKSATMLLGSILTAMLSFQVAANAASDIHYWEVGDPAPGPLLWCGVLAIGLLLGGTILMLHDPRISIGAYVLSLPLMGVYEMEHSKNFLSIPLDDSTTWWLVLGIVVLIAMAFGSMDQRELPKGLR